MQQAWMYVDLNVFDEDDIDVTSLKLSRSVVTVIFTSSRVFLVSDRVDPECRQVVLAQPQPKYSQFSRGNLVEQSTSRQRYGNGVTCIVKGPTQARVQFPNRSAKSA